MSIFFKNFGPYSKLRTANWPITWRKQTQPYNNPFYLYACLTWHKSFNFEAFCCWGEVVAPSEPPPEKERIRKTTKYWTMAVRVEREHSVSEINATYAMYKSSVPVYCLFVFACFLFLLWQFYATSYSLSIPARLQGTETGSKDRDEHFKNKWPNKSNKFLCITSYHDFVFLMIPDPFPL